MTATRKTKPTESPAEELGRLVDELGGINVRLEAIASDSKRAEAIKKELRGLLNTAAASQSTIIQGKLYTAIISARRIENTVNVLKTFKQIGVRGLIAIATVTVKALEDYLPLSKRSGLIESSQTGSRTVTTAVNAPATAAKAA